ncbi:MAG: SUMF1/EgtB/PvdO family nonheme iron enzyme [Nitrospirae bacterium]|nr:SUMF1/EgtB/PvdO family nonheme iron enzyme [Nitrospirota bacterium]MBI3594831.1 SUMF1/EgtB/PvdO family nonheme iron enzyme [Nitrospirota bacterium]
MPLRKRNAFLLIVTLSTAILLLTRHPLRGEKEDSEMVYIPAGPFIMGSDEQDGVIGIDVGVDEIPRHQVNLPAFEIDRYEVTNQQYDLFVQATGHRIPSEPRFPLYYRWEKGHPSKDQEKYPVSYVDYEDAASYCTWRRKRIPTEAEWEKAARGTDARKWPWGNQFDKKKCNTDDSHLSWTLPVGSLPSGASPYGVMEMCGNIAEWTSSWYKPYPGNSLKREAFGESLKVVRGGAWSLPAHPFSRTSHRSYAVKPSKRHRSIGIRCVRDAR